VKNDHITEEKIVDYVLGNLSELEYFKINTHIKHCPKCYLHVQSWQKTLQKETEKQLVAPSKQQVYNTFFHKQRLKRRRLSFILASLSLFVLMTALFFTQQHTNSISSIDLTNEKDIKHFQQVTYTKNNDLNDLTNLFLQTSLPYDYDETINLKTKKRAISPIEFPYINKPVTSEQIVIADDKICSINWDKMEVVCFKYILDNHERIIPFEPKRVNILNH